LNYSQQGYAGRFQVVPGSLFSDFVGLLSRERFAEQAWSINDPFFHLFSFDPDQKVGEFTQSEAFSRTDLVKIPPVMQA
jgi:hypothetical protein